MGKITTQYINDILYWRYRLPDGKEVRVKHSDMSQEEFKEYINSKNYYFGSQFYEKGSKAVNIKTTVATKESKREIKGNYTYFYIMGESQYKGKTYFARSHITRSFDKNNINKLKGDCIRLMAIQALSSKKGIGTRDYDHNLIEEETEILSEIDANATFTYIYTKELD